MRRNKSWWNKTYVERRARTEEERGGIRAEFEVRAGGIRAVRYKCSGGLRARMD